MIFLLLIVTKVAAYTDGDFYAVENNDKDQSYSVFTRVGNCSVYKSDIHQSLFFQHDGIWKIGKIKRFNEIDCRNISSFVYPELNEPFNREPFI